MTSFPRWWPRQIGLLGAVLVVGFLLAARRYSAEQGVGITENQFAIPVLKGKAVNPVLRLKLTTPDAGREVSIFEFNTAGTTRLSDLKTAQVYYCGTDSLLDRALGKGNAKLFGTAEKIGNKLVIKGSQALPSGDAYFWLSYELSKEADLRNFVDATCQQVTLKSGVVKPAKQAETFRQRIGVALRQHGDEGVHTFRIPGLVTTKAGTLLAVYDARRDSDRDLQGNIDIGLSRSTDGGNTWEPMRVALDKGSWGGLPEKFNGVSDPCILVDQNSDAIFVAGLWMYGVINDQGKWVDGLTASSTDWNHQWRTKGSQPGFDVKQTSQFLLTKSTDDGKTWSEPVNITRMGKKEEWWLWAPAPGHGITLTDGTLVFPTQGRDPSGQPFSNITYSKDGGKTWTTTNRASAESTTENMAVQLSDGSIMLNMRANKNRGNTGADNGRAIAVTKDLGQTWQEHPTSFKGLPEPTCMASIHRHAYSEGGKKRSVLLFSNPASKTARDHLTLKVSFDDGMTWPSKHWIVLDELKGRGYSCLTSMDEKNIGIVYESSQADLVFQQIPLAELIR